MALYKQVADVIMYPVIFTEAHQAVCFYFPKREIEKKSVVKQSFRADWFLKWL